LVGEATEARTGERAAGVGEVVAAGVGTSSMAAGDAVAAAGFGTSSTSSYSSLSLIRLRLTGDLRVAAEGLTGDFFGVGDLVGDALTGDLTLDAAAL